MRRTCNYTALTASDLEVNPAFTVVIAYEDFETGKRAKRTYDFLAENLGQECQFINQMWKFDVLSIPKLREIAARDAVEADIVIVSGHGTELPEDVKEWIELWLSQPHKPIALVALFDYLEEETQERHEVREYLANVAKRGDLEFFAQPGAWPNHARQRSMVMLDRDLSNGRALSALAGAVQKDTSYPRWGINE